MAEVRGLQAVANALRKRAAQATKDKASVIVGYTQAYAIYVHEDLTAQHKEGKQAKFLEGPARELSNGGTFGTIIVTALAQGRSIGEALLLAGLRLQRESQLVVPVDTGALKGSAFTRFDVYQSVNTVGAIG